MNGLRLCERCGCTTSNAACKDLCVVKIGNVDKGKIKIRELSSYPSDGKSPNMVPFPASTIDAQTNAIALSS